MRFPNAWLVLALAVSLAAGCGRQLRVVDPQGAPVSGVRVVVCCDASGWMRTAESTTDVSGHAEVASLIEGGPAWMEISRPGYWPERRNPPQRWPLTVVLTPDSQPPPTDAGSVVPAGDGSGLQLLVPSP